MEVEKSATAAAAAAAATAAAVAEEEGRVTTTVCLPVTLRTMAKGERAAAESSQAGKLMLQHPKTPFTKVPLQVRFQLARVFSICLFVCCLFCCLFVYGWCGFVSVGNGTGEWMLCETALADRLLFHFSCKCGKHLCDDLCENGTLTSVEYFLREKTVLEKKRNLVRNKDNKARPQVCRCICVR